MSKVGHMDIYKLMRRKPGEFDLFKEKCSVKMVCYSCLLLLC